MDTRVEPQPDFLSEATRTSLGKSVPEFHRLFVSKTERKLSDENAEAAKSLVRAFGLRAKHLYCRRVPEHRDGDLQGFQEHLRTSPLSAPPPKKAAPGYSFNWPGDGVAEVLLDGSPCPDCARPPPLAEFNADLEWLFHGCAMGKRENTFCFKRLRMLDIAFEFHTLMNEHYERDDCKASCVDFSMISKVDNHIHSASAPTQVELLDFIKMKSRTEGDTVVLSGGTDGDTTLNQCLAACGIDTLHLENVTTQKLGCAADASMFHRFDNFNDSYSPFGKTDLRTIFMKTSNHINGRYFAEMLRDVSFRRVIDQRNQVAIEPRLSIYGNRKGEWEDLAKWVIGHKVLSLDSSGHLLDKVRWMVQIPRLCNVFMGRGFANFDELMRNIFEPMFAATLEPALHPELYTFLCHVGAIDCVDDESVHDPLVQARAVPPAEYCEHANPPYSYWLYHLHANLVVLNRLRESLGLNTLALKPHCGESGQRHHCATGYLIADSINHGIKLVENPTLQYLYYCSQIGLGLCPQSNDALFMRLKDSPIGMFHRRGLRVCVGTDDPLQFSNTANPVIEEYIVSKKAFNFSDTDLCEIARNSVLTSAFNHATKARMLGEHYSSRNLVKANNRDLSNVSDIRAAFRHGGLFQELQKLCNLAGVERDAGGMASMGGYEVPDASDAFHVASETAKSAHEHFIATVPH